MPKPRRELPWWLEAGTEICPVCSQIYAHRTEIYCVHCDAVVCAVCVQQTVTLELVCPGCFESAHSQREVG